jgi:hypothetical protein
MQTAETDTSWLAVAVQNIFTIAGTFISFISCLSYLAAAAENMFLQPAFVPHTSLMTPRTQEDD